MANRSTIIIGRILRNLKRHDVSFSSIQDEEILGEINSAVNQIISEVRFSKIVSITLAEGVTKYPLTTDTVTGDTVSYKKNIASVKVLEVPSGWLYRFDVIPEKEYIDKVNANLLTAVGHPSIGTIIDGELHIFSEPGESNDEKVIKLHVYLRSASITVDKDTEPELPEVFDKCIEAYTTAQFLSGVDRDQWLSEYAREVKRLTPLVHTTNFNLQRGSIF